ncbi:MAG: RluA family pseudouridine synthase [Proteobacteria bacterium]|nr:RluA family pseudouridine synthase [Pseudomonadota bacterium]MBU1420436.1 RluA family pseudouridine synthase [Pseudomonadota bacterium]MBU1456361.1 RluA family pseudouridine synthase [Pseudomonadota bacterium]
MTLPSASISVDTSHGGIDLRVSPEQAGSRFDHFLVLTVPETSRVILVQSIRQGFILVDGEKKKSSYRLKQGERVSGTLFQQPSPELIAEEVPFRILFEDDYLLILSKPPGVVVHPGSGNPSGTLVNGLLHHCRTIGDVGDEMRPGIVHRLDKDTSGIMVVAKTEPCHRLLIQAFKARSVQKEYLALLSGTLGRETGRVVAPIGRHPVHRQKMAICERKGRYAASSWQVVEEYETGYSLVRVRIETGRTHQIRVHMASLGHPVAGDMVYGRGGGHKQNFPRQMLHAHKLGFLHPITGREIAFSAPLWPDFQEILEMFRHQGDEEIGPVS